MKVVIYCNDDNRNKLNGAAVTAQSVKKRGNLPESTEYILYTQRIEQAKNYKPVQIAFDEVASPPIGIDWGKVPKWHPVKKRPLYKEQWTKILSWINTPCEGEPVILIDYDILCLGSIREAIPPDGEKLFSGRLGWVKKMNQSAIGCNGGFLIKTPKFDESDAPKIMIQPLFNGIACYKSKNTWNITDEGATTWYFLRRGFDCFLSLEYKFNELAKTVLKKKKQIGSSDIRMLHYAGNNKPWGNEQRKKTDGAFREICKPWDAELAEIMQKVQEEKDGI